MFPCWLRLVTTFDTATMSMYELRVHACVRVRVHTVFQEINSERRKLENQIAVTKLRIVLAYVELNANIEWQVEPSPHFRSGRELMASYTTNINNLLTRQINCGDPTSCRRLCATRGSPAPASRVF
ncbi:hypothetical protein NP493_65g03025 [Ridgeia piscesae]|uniref:Uncharacterized protein n=1 Tax=Ridgeia piscesae TaxID=27915 RepID=A0AAD9PA36_RIDPI|nr:hypothetical protein NP493_65g03025 [Ridgeia piscesae]